MSSRVVISNSYFHDHCCLFRVLFLVYYHTNDNKHVFPLISFLSFLSFLPWLTRQEKVFDHGLLCRSESFWRFWPPLKVFPYTNDTTYIIVFEFLSSLLVVSACIYSFKMTVLTAESSVMIQTYSQFHL